MDINFEVSSQFFSSLREVNQEGWIIWNHNGFSIVKKKPNDKEINRESLSHCFELCRDVVERRGYDADLAGRFLRLLWNEEAPFRCPKNIPGVIGVDNFLRMYALGQPVDLALVQRIWKRLEEPINENKIKLMPIKIGWNAKHDLYFDVDATPPGFLPKILTFFRLKKDQEQFLMVTKDLELVSSIEDSQKRKWLTIAILSHGAAYREIDGKEIMIPSFQECSKMIPYHCTRHLIAEGVKTFSLVPIPPEPHIPRFYLCQGTELWPSQPLFLGSILANFAQHGAATEAYAHSWRRIHKHLRDLKPTEDIPFPIVLGHSMGGSLAMQIALYSHDLIDQAYAFNPPLPNDRDYAFYHELAPDLQKKLNVSANLDDFVFWRIGAKVVGQVTLFLGKKRWRYVPIGLWDLVFLFPMVFKFLRNMRRAFPAHQKIVPLQENHIAIQLTQEEIEKENFERTTRFDYMRFFPRLYDPTKTLLRWIRKLFKWSLEEEFLENEIEIIALHERDLIDTINEENRLEIEHELEELKKQKSLLLIQLRRIQSK